MANGYVLSQVADPQGEEPFLNVIAWGTPEQVADTIADWA